MSAGLTQRMPQASLYSSVVYDPAHFLASAIGISGMGNMMDYGGVLAGDYVLGCRCRALC